MKQTPAFQDDKLGLTEDEAVAKILEGKHRRQKTPRSPKLTVKKAEALLEGDAIPGINPKSDRVFETADHGGDQMAAIDAMLDAQVAREEAARAEAAQKEAMRQFGLSMEDVRGLQAAADRLREKGATEAEVKEKSIEALATWRRQQEA